MSPSHYFEGVENQSPARAYLVSNFVRLLGFLPVFVAGPGWDTCSPACRVVEVEDGARAPSALRSNSVGGGLNRYVVSGGNSAGFFRVRGTSCCMLIELFNFGVLTCHAHEFKLGDVFLDLTTLCIC